MSFLNFHSECGPKNPFIYILIKKTDYNSTSSESVTERFFLEENLVGPGPDSKRDASLWFLFELLTSEGLVQVWGWIIELFLQRRLQPQHLCPFPKKHTDLTFYWRLIISEQTHFKNNRSVLTHSRIWTFVWRSLTLKTMFKSVLEAE